jgi:urease accessory protein
VETGARLLLTTPSASRAHRMNNGRAELVQQMRVAAGGFLEFWPELFIPQKGTRYSQRTELTVEGDGNCSSSSPWLPAAWPRVSPLRIQNWSGPRTSVATPCWWRANAIVFTPEGEAVRTLRSAFSDAYYASGFVISDRLERHEVWERIHALHASDAWIGCSRLANRGWAIKLVAAGSVALRRMLQAVRSELYRAMNRPAPSLRRAGSAW